MSELTKINFQIIEFQPKYQHQIIDLIGGVLKELKVIPQSNKSLGDEDLYKIAEVYKDRGRFWIAIIDNKVIGTVAVREMGQSVAKLNRMFVLTKYHGTGVGQSLLDHALKFAKQQEYTSIILNTHLLMKRAHRFYEKNGFKIINEGNDKYHYRLAL